MTVIEKPKQLKLGESNTIFPLETRTPETYERLMQILGNSLLSTLYVKTIGGGGSVTAKFFDSITDDRPGDRFELDAHTVAITAGFLERIIVTRIHSRPISEIVVAGASAEFALFVTVVSEFAADLDSALKKDAEDADLLLDKGLPVMCYDEVKDKFFFQRCKDGSIVVSDDLSGNSDHFTATVGTTPVSLPTVADKDISAVLINTQEISPSSKRLLVSFDGGTKFLTLKRNTIIGWSPRGPLKQIVVKGSVASVEYDIVINFLA